MQNAPRKHESINVQYRSLEFDPAIHTIVNELPVGAFVRPEQVGLVYYGPTPGPFNPNFHEIYTLILVSSLDKNGNIEYKYVTRKRITSPPGFPQIGLTHPQYQDDEKTIQELYDSIIKKDTKNDV